MTRLRMLSTERFSSWGYEDLLNFVLNARQDQGCGTFEDQWNPLYLLNSTGFGDLENCDSVLAVEEQENGDVKVRVKITEAYEGGALREETVQVYDGRERFLHLRKELQAQLRMTGNVHWGDVTDVKALSDALDVGILLFCNRLQDSGRTCLYNTGSEKHAFPYWIGLYYEDGRHFRVAELSDVMGSPGEGFTCFWTGEVLPPVLYHEYEKCNRAKSDLNL